MSEMEPVAGSRKPLLPVVGAVAAVLAVAVAVAYVGAGSSEPRKLRLSGGSTAEARDSVRLGAPGTASSSGGSGYRLVGTLPAGQPDDAPVWELDKGQASLAQVAALAKALKAGTPARQDGGWRAGGLFVSDAAGQSWYFAPCMTSKEPISPDVRVGCATASGTAVAPAPATSPVSDPDPGTSGKEPEQPDRDTPTSCSANADCAAPAPSPVPEPDPVPAATVREAAAPVLEALGLDIADAHVQTSPYGGSAVVGHTAGGLTAAGWETRVDVDRAGAITNASGYLADAARGDAYPLLSAQEAFDALPPMVERLALCPVGPDGQGCAEPEPAEVTGARLGLVLHPMEGDELGLVPAWLFAVEGWDQPMPVVAVEPEYIARPEPPKDQPATSDPGAGGGAPGDPGQVEPVPPASTKPEPAPNQPSAEPAGGRTPISFTEAYRTADPDKVRIRYYEDGCGWDNVSHAVKESADTVVVLVEADERPADQVCTEQAIAVDRVVDLQAPLGDRSLVDGASGRPVTVSAGT